VDSGQWFVVSRGWISGPGFFFIISGRRVLPCFGVFGRVLACFGVFLEGLFWRRNTPSPAAAFPLSENRT